MSLRLQANYVVPAETKRVTEAIFPNENSVLPYGKNFLALLAIRIAIAYFRRKANQRYLPGGWHWLSKD